MNYKSCFSCSPQTVDQYRPLFWYSDADKRDYEHAFDIKHSDCYTKYGFRRTGCVGCPFALDLMDNLKITEQYEPQLYKACTSIFGKSYEYTKQYREFRRRMTVKEKNPDQLDIYDLYEV